jgi:hypothetical protein
VVVLTPARREELHRRGLRLEWFTVAWNVVEAFVVIGVGLVVGSVALIGFGVDSGIEVISAVALLWRLYTAGPNASAEEHGDAERKALHLVGCQVGGNAFLATGATVFNGASVGDGAEVRVNGTVHLRTALPAEAVVPIGWVAVGEPAEVLAPGEHERIWELQEPLDFPGTVFGVERGPAGTMMPELTRHYAAALGAHLEDAELPAK